MGGRLYRGEWVRALLELGPVIRDTGERLVVSFHLTKIFIVGEALLGFWASVAVCQCGQMGIGAPCLRLCHSCRKRADHGRDMGKG